MAGRPDLLLNRLESMRYHCFTPVSVLLLLPVCFSAQSPPKPRPRSFSVILITVDTLRADHMGCYGYRKELTPHIDALTRGGTLFQEVNSQVPLTLPSFTSLMTSTYPFSSRVEENGEIVPPGTLTLARILNAHGYRTAAFVGGYVLDRHFGLDQGFDFYNSPFNVRLQPDDGAIDLKRDASDVVHSATVWLNANSGQPFFIWVHLFDLHRPYSLPAAKSEQNAKGYDRELRHVDTALGGFWKYLTDRGLFSKALIVFTADHGESLGQHGEETHGYFIYESTLRVPLIFHWPKGTAPMPGEISALVGLINLAPTVLQYLGLRRPAQFQGQSLLPLLDGRKGSAPRETYSESLYARDHFGWAALRSLRVGDYKYISAPKPELYSLARDPQELRNIVDTQKAQAVTLAAQLPALLSRYAPRRQAQLPRLSPEELALLGSLGYVASVQVRSGADPKDKLPEYRQYQKAIELTAFGHYSHAARLLRAITARDYLNIQAHFSLAVCDFKSGEQEEAVRQLHATLSLSPDFVRAQELLGTIFLERRDYAQARAEFEKLLATLPTDYGANYNLGELDLMAGRVDAALEHFQKAAWAAPRSALVHSALGGIYLRAGQLRKAQNEFEEDVRLQPDSAPAHYNLGLAFEKEGLSERAAQQFRESLAKDPGYQLARRALDRLEK
jgi:choline-sulfatase